MLHKNKAWNICFAHFSSGMLQQCLLVHENVVSLSPTYYYLQVVMYFTLYYKCFQPTWLLYPIIVSAPFLSFIQRQRKSYFKSFNFV